MDAGGYAALKDTALARFEIADTARVFKLAVQKDVEPEDICPCVDRILAGYDKDAAHP